MHIKCESRIVWSLCGLKASDGVHLPHLMFPRELAVAVKEQWQAREFSGCFSTTLPLLHSDVSRVLTPLTSHLCVLQNSSDTFDLIHGASVYEPKFRSVIFITALVSTQIMRKLKRKKKKLAPEMSDSPRQGWVTG